MLRNEGEGTGECGRLFAVSPAAMRGDGEGGVHTEAQVGHFAVLLNPLVRPGLGFLWEQVLSWSAAQKPYSITHTQTLYI